MSAYPSAASLRQQGERPEGQTFVVRKKLQTVHVPASLEYAKQNHRYEAALDEEGNKVMAYVPKPFDPTENQYPKMLYHPTYGKGRKPRVDDYARGVSAENIEPAMEKYQTALDKWEKGNRVKVAEDPAREDELRKIGWVDYKDLKHLRAEAKQADSDAL